MSVSGRVSPEDSMILYVTSQDADFDGSGTLDREEFVEICGLAKNMRNKNDMKGWCVIRSEED